MRKNRAKTLLTTLCVIILVASLILLSGCANLSNGTTEAKSLNTPTNVRIDTDNKTLRWNTVEGADGYIVAVDGDEYSCNNNQYDLSTISLTVGQKYSVKVKAKGNGKTYKSSDFSSSINWTKTQVIESSNENPLETEINNSSFLAVSRYEVVQAPTDSGIPIVMDKTTDGVKNYYLLDVGYVKNMPVSYGPTMRYKGETSIEVSFSKSDTTEEKVETSVSKAVSETISDTQMNEAGAKLSVSYESPSITKLWGGKLTVGVEGHYSRTWGTVTENSNSITNTYSTAQSKSQTLTQAVTFAVGGKNEPFGYYRLTMFSTCDIYFLVTTNRENSEVLDCTVIINSRPESLYLELDYDANGTDFGKTSSSQEIEFAKNYYRGLPIPTYVDPKPEVPQPEVPLTANSEIVTTTFNAYVWCESRNVGQATFSVTGIKVRYNGQYYVYGNAWYQGTLGGDRFNDVDTISLRNASRKTLIGGTLHWQGSVDDNNESGVAGWNKSSGSDSTNTYYMVEDPGKDLAANKIIKISITDICVQIDGTTQIDNTVPEIVTTTFTSDFYCESTYKGNLTFSVIGLKVKYNGNYYIMGNAYYSGTPGGSRFNDVDQIELKNSSRLILFGGTLHWQGSVDDNNESGVAGFDKNGGSNSITARYMVEDPGKDFASNENNRISITGICVRLSATDSNANIVPEIATTTFQVSLYCESQFVGNANFTVTGIKVKYNNTNYIYGNAFFSGTPGGNRFNDVDTLWLKNSTKNILLGGTLHYAGSKDDNNESAIAGYNKNDSTSTNIKYMMEDPGKDFAANETNRISITGICVQI